MERSRASRSSPTTLALLFALLGGALVIVWPALFPRKIHCLLRGIRRSTGTLSVETNSDRSGPKNTLTALPSPPPRPPTRLRAGLRRQRRRKWLPWSESTVAPDEAPCPRTSRKTSVQEEDRKKSRSK